MASHATFVMSPCTISIRSFIVTSPRVLHTGPPLPRAEEPPRIGKKIADIKSALPAQTACLNRNLVPPFRDIPRRPQPRFAKRLRRVTATRPACPSGRFSLSPATRSKVALGLPDERCRRRDAGRDALRHLLGTESETRCHPERSPGRSRGISCPAARTDFIISAGTPASASESRPGERWDWRHASPARRNILRRSRRG